jgi:hypothetical protein
MKNTIAKGHLRCKGGGHGGSAPQKRWQFLGHFHHILKGNP